MTVKFACTFTVFCAIVRCNLCLFYVYLLYLIKPWVGNLQFASRMLLFHLSAVAPCSVGVQYTGEVSPRLLLQPKLLPCTFSRSNVLKERISRANASKS